MSGTPLCLLEQLAADERAVRAAGDLARRLLAEHSDLPVTAARIRYGTEVHLAVPTPDAVHAWAHALSTAVVRCVNDPGYAVFEHHNAIAEVEDHRVCVWWCRSLTDTEATTWRAQHTTEKGPQP